MPSRIVVERERLVQRWQTVAGFVERCEAPHLLARGDQADQLVLSVGNPFKHAVGPILKFQPEPAIGADVLRVIGEYDQRALWFSGGQIETCEKTQDIDTILNTRRE